MTNGELMEELRRATQGVSMMSETDHLFETVELEDAYDLTPERLRELTGSPPDSPGMTQSICEFFGADADRYARLIGLLEERLAGARLPHRRA